MLNKPLRMHFRAAVPSAAKIGVKAVGHMSVLESKFHVTQRKIGRTLFVPCRLQSPAPYRRKSKLRALEVTTVSPTQTAGCVSSFLSSPLGVR